MLSALLPTIENTIFYVTTPQYSDQSKALFQSNFDGHGGSKPEVHS